MYPRVRWMAGWPVVGLLLCASSHGLAGARDSATLAPQDSLLYVGWSGIDGDCELIGLARAIIASPLVQSRVGEEIAGVDKVLAWIDKVRHHTGALVILPGEETKDGPLVNMALIVAAGKEAGALADALEEVVQTLSEGEEVETTLIEGTAFKRVSDGPGPLPHLRWAVVGEHLVAALGEPAARRTLAHLKTGGKSLAEHPDVVLARRKIKPSEEGWSVSVFCEYAAFVKLVLHLENENASPTVDSAAALKIFQPDAIQSFYLHVDSGELGVRLSVFTRVTEGAGGLVRLWKQNPLSDADIAVIPKNAYWAQAWNLDVVALWQEALTVVEKIGPDARPKVDAVLAAAQVFLGFSLVDTLLPAFGESWALYDAPEHGGLLFTGIVLVNEVRDAQVVHDCFARVVEVLTPLAEQAGINLVMREAKIEGQTVHYVLLGGLPIPVAPAWGFAQQRWVFGLFPQTVATALKQADPQRRGSSLLDHPDFQRIRPLLPKELTGVIYRDSRYYQQWWYPLAHLARTAVAALSVGSEPSFDLATVPTWPRDLNAVRNVVGGTSFDADGFLYTVYGSTPLSLLVGGGEVTVGATALGVSILLPSLTRARELAKRAVSAANLRGIGQACLIYASDHADRFPPSLEALVKEGLVSPQMLQSPLDPEETVSYVYVAGQTVADDALNVLAYERLRTKEGTNVLFLDGHVEFMKAAEFKDAVRRTYKRLKREREIPAEFRE